MKYRELVCEEPASIWQIASAFAQEPPLSGGGTHTLLVSHGSSLRRLLRAHAAMLNSTSQESVGCVERVAHT